MVSKGAVVLVGLIAATAMAVGAFVGGELGGVTNAAPTATPTTDGDGGGVAAATPTPGPTATPRPTVAPSSFDRSGIEAAVRAGVNAERRDRGLAELRRLDPLAEMARFHSENMAAQKYVSHAAAGYDTKERYERFGLADRCRVPDDSATGIRDGRALETLAKTAAGRPAGSDGEAQIDRTEEDVAATVVGDWMADATAREKLTLAEASYVGVGVVVADDGATYVTLDLC